MKWFRSILKNDVFFLLLLLPLLANYAKGRVSENLRGVIWSDCEGYYSYLPAVFNIGDVHKLPEGSMNARKNDRGEVVIKYTAGVSYFQLPFFLGARYYCDTHGIERSDYFNRHYSRAIALAGVVAAWLGLLFLFKALKNLDFSRLITWLTLIVVFFGTNLFHYTTKEMGMSHAYSFCLFAVLLWHLPFFYKNPNWRNSLILGVLCGWIVLIRPTNIVPLLLVPLYNVDSFAALSARFRWFGAIWQQLLAVVAAALVMVFPQMLYWREMTGKWLLYSYGGEGQQEDFRYWNHPKIADVLFDVQNGLFLYSPLVLLMVLGMLTNWRKTALQSKTLLFIFVVSTYIFASWWAWWFGGAFGHRSYVELYAFFALPTAGILHQIWQLRSAFVKYSLLALIAFLTFYSVRMSILYTKLPGPWDGADWRWNPEKILWVWEHLFQF